MIHTIQHSSHWRPPVVGSVMLYLLLTLGGSLVPASLSHIIVPSLMAQSEAITAFSLGYEQYRQKNYLGAIPYYQKFMAVAEEDNQYWDGILSQIGVCYTKLGENDPAMFDSAVVIYKMAIVRKPDSAKLNHQLEWLYERTGQEEKVIAQMEVMYKLTKDVVWIQQLQKRYLNKQEYDKAVATYDILLEADPENQEYKDGKLNLIRQIAMESGDSDSMEDAVFALHEQYPENTDYISELLNFASNKQDEEAILKWADVLLSVEPANTYALDTKMEVFEFRGDTKMVLVLLHQKVEMDPDDPYVHCRIAEVHLDNNAFVATVRAARMALKVQSGLGAAYLLIGEAYDISADNCVSKKGGMSKLSFDDKLVFKKAYDYYARAAQDPEYKAQAQRKMRSLNEVIPGKGDYFMNKGKEEPTGPCYTWF